MAVSTPLRVTALAEPVSGPESTSVADDGLRRDVERVLLGLIVAIVFARVVLVWRLNVNWDEFNYLSYVHASVNGTLSIALQTFHVHLFRWVLGAGANEVDQIIAARLAYYVLSLGSCTFLYLIARRYTSRPAALFSVLCYLCYSSIIEHGTSFRADGLVSFVTLGVLALIVTRPGAWIAAVFAGTATALAILITLKTVFAVPTILVLLVIGTWELGRRRVATSLILFAIGFAVAFGLGLLVQAAGVRDASADHLTTFSRRVAGVTLRSAGSLGLPYVLTTIGQNGFAWIYIATALALLRSSRFRERWARRDVIALYSLALPLLSLLVYRNTFPYFFVFLIPPVLVLCAIPFEVVVQRGAIDASYRRVALYMVAAVTWAFSLRFAVRLPDEVTHQRRLLAVVHEIFPRPVPYIDRSGFVASFPKVGLFMSTWGMQGYLAGGIPVFDNLLQTRSPALLVVNSPALALSPDDSSYAGPGGYPLLDEDQRVLRENFIHHWGPLYVAGKRVILADTAIAARVIIAGTYTVEGIEEVEVDGVRYSPGESIRLENGSHRFRKVGRGSTVTLRWGRSLRRPDWPPFKRAIFVGF